LYDERFIPPRNRPVRLRPVPARASIVCLRRAPGSSVEEEFVNQSSGSFRNPDDERIREILRSMRRVAVVGISAKEDRASHGIARFLIGRDLDVVGVNPQLDEVLGIPVYPDLKAVPGELDVVDIFRRSDAVGPIVDEAIAHGAGCVWMQEGVVNEPAALRALAAGMAVVMDRCIYQEWLRLMNV
jgi:predicted CoA-binding protein